MSYAPTVSAIGLGISLAYATTSGGSYVALAEILSLKPSEPAVEEVKVARSDNTTAVVEKLPGWQENGDAEFEITYAPAQRALLEGYLRTPGYWKIIYPKVGGQTGSGDSEIFPGFLNHLGKETPIKGAMTCKCKIAVSGPIAYTQGS